MMDIRFYDFDFNLLYILPPYTLRDCRGYKAVHAEPSFNGNGSFECTFNDPELKKIIEEKKDTILVMWNDFQGFLTSFKWSSKENLITGMHLNGLLHRAVIPSLEEATVNPEQCARDSVSKNIPWLTLGDEQGIESEISYAQEKYMRADEFLEELFELAGLGYKIFADIPNKKFVFECLKSEETQLMLSEGNLNIYDVELTYINKNLAFGGWYFAKQPDDEEGNSVDSVWTYITLDESKEGIYKIDTVLGSTTETEAMNELKALKSKYETTGNTKEIQFGKDYKLGDIVRMQIEGVTVRKRISGVQMWNEKSYGEMPIFTEV